MGEIHQHCPSGLLANGLAGLTESPFQVGADRHLQLTQAQFQSHIRPFFAGGGVDRADQLAVGGCGHRFDHLSPHPAQSSSHHHGDWSDLACRVIGRPVGGSHQGLAVARIR